MNLLFFFICADRAVFGTTETAQEKLKCTTFEASYFMFSGAKTVFFYPSNIEYIKYVIYYYYYVLLKYCWDMRNCR